MILNIKATGVQVNPETMLIEDTFKVPCSFLESGGISVPQVATNVGSAAKTMVVSAVNTVGSGLNFMMRGVLSIGRNLLPCSVAAASEAPEASAAPAASAAPEAAAAEASAAVQISNFGDEAEKLRAEINVVEVDLPKRKGDADGMPAKEPGEDDMGGQPEILKVIELSPEQEERLTRLLDSSQPLISENLISEDLRADLRAVVGEVQAPDEQFQNFLREEKEKQNTESKLVKEKDQDMLSGLGDVDVAEATLRAERDAAAQAAAESETAKKRKFGGGGKPRTRRRRSSSSTRSSTTRGRKSKSRRNQSKKHKQNSRRRRNSRKASRKN